MKCSKTLAIFALFAILLILTGCVKSISEIKKPEYVGKTVTVRGTVKSSFKIGSISGYTITDESGESIGVSSEELPQEGKTITVKGVLIKDTIFGYYIKS